MRHNNSLYRLGLGGTAWLALWLALGGCASLSARIGSDDTGLEHGKTWFVGGAGMIGNVVGTTDVPRGLRKGEYRGAIEVFGWQSAVGWALRDQMDRDRNEKEGRRLAGSIRAYMNRFPGRPVNIIALSAGTGVAVWALEALPRGSGVETAVFLSSSLSREYDLTKALEHVRGRLHNFYSEADPLLLLGMPITGTVDRRSGTAGPAGLTGFATPPSADERTRYRYAEQVRDHTYREEWREYGYFGFHADSTSPVFIQKVIAPLLDNRPEPSADSAVTGAGPDRPPDRADGTSTANTELPKP